MPKRLDAEDTVDSVTHFLHRLQADGWGIESMEHHIDYVAPKPGGRKLPVAASVTVTLTPTRDHP